MDTEHIDVVIDGRLWAAVQIIKLLAWPAVLVCFIFVIKPHVGPLIESLSRRKVKFKGPMGTEAEFDAVEQQQKAGGNNPVIVKQEEEITAPPRMSKPASAAVAHIEQEVIKIMQNAEITEPAKQVPLLLRDLANTRIRAGHEYVYNRIFGSQIAFLKRLDEQGACPPVEAKLFFDEYLDRYPQLKDYGFDKWIGFLSSNLLIEFEGPGWKTTVYGHDFIVYIAQNALSADKFL